MYPFCPLGITLSGINALFHIKNPFSVQPYLFSITVSRAYPHSGIPGGYVLFQKSHCGKWAMAWICGIQFAHGYSNRNTHRSKVIYAEISALGFVIRTVPYTSDVRHLQTVYDVIHHDTTGRIPVQEYFLRIDFILFVVRLYIIDRVNTFIDCHLGPLL